MIPKPRKDGRIGYHWSPTSRDIAAGFSLTREALGTAYGPAVERANLLNAHLDAWRDGRSAEKIDIAQPGFGSVGWLFDQYHRHRLYRDKVSARAKGGYERAMRAIEDLPTKSGSTVSRLPVASIDAAAVDKIYDRLLKGPLKDGRATQAGYAIDIARRAWNVVQRLHPKVLPPGNPWVSVERVGKKGTKPAATREEAYELAEALRKIGEPHLGAAALICFEWHQRPENVLAGAITWGDYNPPDCVLIRHKKNDVEVVLPLGDDAGPFYPELERYLAALPRLAHRSYLLLANAVQRGLTHGPTLSAVSARPGNGRDLGRTSHSTPADMVGSPSRQMRDLPNNICARNQGINPLAHCAST